MGSLKAEGRFYIAARCSTAAPHWLGPRGESLPEKQRISDRQGQGALGSSDHQRAMIPRVVRFRRRLRDAVVRRDTVCLPLANRMTFGGLAMCQTLHSWLFHRVAANFVLQLGLLLNLFPPSSSFAMDDRHLASSSTIMANLSGHIGFWPSKIVAVSIFHHDYSVVVHVISGIFVRPAPSGSGVLALS